MITNLDAPANSEKWFKDWNQNMNRQLNAIVNQSQGKTNPVSNIQEFSVTVQFSTDGSSAIIPINIMNKLKFGNRVISPRNVVLGNISRLDSVPITSTPQIIWRDAGANITILSIGGLSANINYTATFNINI